MIAKATVEQIIKSLVDDASENKGNDVLLSQIIDAHMTLLLKSVQLERYLIISLIEHRQDGEIWSDIVRKIKKRGDIYF